MNLAGIRQEKGRRQDGREMDVAQFPFWFQDDLLLEFQEMGTERV